MKQNDSEWCWVLCRQNEECTLAGVVFVSHARWAHSLRSFVRDVVCGCGWHTYLLPHCLTATTLAAATMHNGRAKCRAHSSSAYAFCVRGAIYYSRTGNDLLIICTYIRHAHTTVLTVALNCLYVVSVCVCVLYFYYGTMLTIECNCANVLCHHQCGDVVAPADWCCCCCCCIVRCVTIILAWSSGSGEGRSK